MMDTEGDILKEIPKEELPLIRDYYLNHLPYATHVYSFFNTAMKWIKLGGPDRQLFKFYAPSGDWKSDGTFLVLFEFTCYDIFLFTMDPKCERLYEALSKTKKFDYSGKEVLFYATHINHRDAVVKAMETINVPIFSQTETYIYWMPKEEASQLTFTCPEGYYIDILRPEHATIINDVWPHRYKDSVEYIRTFIEMNQGHGVFTKNDNQLVSWCLKNPMGTLGQLQTLDEHKRKGLGSVVTKSLSKEIGLEGHNPIGTVLLKNEASKAMFSKIGFRILDTVVYINVGSRE